MNRIYSRLLRTAALAAVMLSASSLHAITFSLQNCASCLGAVFEVTATQTNVANNIWHIKWTMDLSGVNSANVTNLSAIAIQVAGGSGVETFPTTYTLSHAGQTISNSGWTLYQDAAVSNAANCDGTGNPQGFLCLAYANSTGSPLKTGVSGLYAWEFDIDLKAGVTPGGSTGEIPIRGNFDPANGKLLSDVARVPEGIPGELPLLLTGLVSLVALRKRASV